LISLYAAESAYLCLSMFHMGVPLF
jgi:hypothetical protein